MCVENRVSAEIETARQAIVEGQETLAQSTLDTILTRQPCHPGALHLRSMMLAKDSHYMEAADFLTQALRWRPDECVWRRDLAVIWSAAGNWDRAASLFSQVLDRTPCDTTALLGYARALINLGDTNQALRICEKVVELEPEHAETLCCLARLLIRLDRTSDAVQALHQAISLDPLCADCRRLLGRLYADQDGNEQARHHLETALRLSPGDLECHGNLVSICWKLGDLESTVSHARVLIDAGRATVALRSFYLYLLLYDNRETASSIAEACARFGEAMSPKGAPKRQFRSSNEPRRRLKVGYLTGEFMCGAAFFFLSPLLGNHDPSNVEVFCYHTRPVFDQATKWYTSAGHWRDCRGIDDEGIKRRIRRDGIDILVDLSGVFPEHRLSIFAERAAPIQVTYPNCPMTTGIPNMDYILTDEWCCPPGMEGQYTEHAVRIPSGYLAYAPPPGAPSVTPLPAIQNSALTFGLFQRRAKMNTVVWDTVAKILRRRPDSRLIIQNMDPTLADHRSRNYQELVRAFGNRGIRSERLRIVGALSQLQTMALMAEADIALDTFPYQGQTTTCECLWMGVPVVALTGESHAARSGSAILRRVGLERLATRSRAEYVATVLELTRDLPNLARMRADMRDRLRNSTLLDGKRLASEIEAAYREMWERWCSRTGATEGG